MPRHILTDIQGRNAKPKDKRYRLADGDRLFLAVTPGGVKIGSAFRRSCGCGGWSLAEQVRQLKKMDRGLVSHRPRRRAWMPLMASRNP